MRAGDFRINDQAGVHRRVDARNLDLALIVHLDLDDRRDVSQKALMRRDAQPRSLAELAFSPAGFLRHHLGNSPQPARFPRISFKRSTIIRVIYIFEIDRARFANQVE